MKPTTATKLSKLLRELGPGVASVEDSLKYKSLVDSYVFRLKLYNKGAARHYGARVSKMLTEFALQK